MSLREGNFFLQVQGLIARRKFLLASARTHCAKEISSCKMQGLIARRKFLLASARTRCALEISSCKMQGLVARCKFLLAGARARCAAEISSCRCKDSLRGENVFPDLLAGSNRPDLPPAEDVSFGVADDYSFAESFVGTIIRFLAFTAAKVVVLHIPTKCFKDFKETLTSYNTMLCNLTNII